MNTSTQKRLARKAQETAPCDMEKLYDEINKTERMSAMTISDTLH